MRLFLDGDRLQRLASDRASAYQTAEPFPHAVIDDALPSEMLDVVLRDFPDPSSDVWTEYQSYHEGKLETQGEANLSDATSLVLYQFNSAPFVRFLETLTGIAALIPDPHFSGGGLHQIPTGGKLGIHADFSIHGRLRVDRRLNVLIYLNRDWRDDYGGNLELWSRDRTHCVQSIAPVFNRMVVFNVTDWAFHGHPDPLACPPDVTRKSIALYYYTSGRPEGETMPGKLSTLFIRRPGEAAPAGTRFERDPHRRGDRFRAIVKALTPPVVFDSAMRLRRRRGS